MNPEVRFRVPEHVLALAEEVASQRGLHQDGDRSGGVSNLAREAFYRELGLGIDGQSGCARGRVRVWHGLDDAFRRQELVDRGRSWPQALCTDVDFEIADASPEVRALLRSPHGEELRGYLQAPDLRTEGPARLEDLENYLRATPWTPFASLTDWARQHGSELVKMRIEEGFEWQGLAESEWFLGQVQTWVGSEVEVEEYRPEQGLAPGWDRVHSCYPDREPSIARMKMLQEMRSKAQACQVGVRLTLVLGEVHRLESRKRRRQESFEALLWQLTTPSGTQLGLLSHRRSLQGA